MPIILHIDSDREWVIDLEKILKLNLQEDLRDIQDILVLLGSKTRVKILKLISDGGIWTLKDLGASMTTKVSNLSQHMDKLEAAGLIEKIREKGTSRKLIIPVYERIVIDLK